MSLKHEHPADETRVALKAADQTVNNSDVLEDCDDLKLEVGANEVWGFFLFILQISGATPDIKFGWTVPDSCTMKWTDLNHASPGTLLSELLTYTHPGAGVNQHLAIDGLIVASSTPGTVQLQFAQNTAEVSDTKVLANSYLVAWKLK